MERIRRLRPIKMSKIIRKITIGREYKDNAMHYSVNQSAYGGHEIYSIEDIDSENLYRIFIKKDDEVKPWKDVNKNMGVSVEYDLEY